VPDDPAISGDRLVNVLVTDGIAWITLNDPARRNCVSVGIGAASSARFDPRGGPIGDHGLW
jgi:hypothetical protein